MPFELLPALAGGIIGSALTAANRWWQYKRENWYLRTVSFCEIASKSADVASTYWLDEIDSSLLSAGPSKELTEARGRFLKNESIVLGLQVQLDGFYGTFADRLTASDLNQLKKSLRELCDALTGGQFQVKDRKIDVVRARSVHVFASSLIVETRRSVDTAIKVGGLYKYAIGQPRMQSLAEYFRLKSERRIS